MTEKKTRGGRRPGAGRPSNTERGLEKKRRYTIRLYPATWAEIEKAAAAEGIPVAQWFDKFIGEALKK